MDKVVRVAGFIAGAGTAHGAKKIYDGFNRQGQDKQKAGNNQQVEGPNTHIAGNNEQSLKNTIMGFEHKPVEL